jgi:ribosomal protein L24E
MTFLYRFAVTITRKGPYIDWANSFDDGGPTLTDDLADDRRTVYLVPEATDRPNLAAIVDEFWQAIFEEELAMWMENEADWPNPRTRELFDAWFGVVVTDSVFDLAPEEPLTQRDVDLIDLHDAVERCAWCEIEVEPGAGRYVGFKLSDRAPFEHRAGLVLPLRIDDERVVSGIVAMPESEEARAGEDVIFRACTSRCEKALRSAVPKALRKMRRG